jgi:uncharacterized protein involved in exopolysaccharide biosynthesis
VSRKEEPFESRSAPGAIDASFVVSEDEMRISRERTISRLRLVWGNRRRLIRVFFWSLLASTLIAFLIPKSFQSTTQLMPPDNQSASSMALLSAVAGRTGGLGAFAGDLLGVKSSGALFVGVLQSRTVRDRLIEKFGLMRIYRKSKLEDAREALAEHTGIYEDRKSGIITITVTDHDPNRAAALAQAYITELDQLVAQVSTSSARRERIFLEERLTTVKQDLNGAAKKFSEFASKNTAIDIPAQGKAMVEAAATLQGQLIAAESELRGLEAIYSDQNVRVRALRARVSELRTQLGKLGGDSGAEGALSSKSDPSLYPSIRQLPVLGVTYADLYRQTKIEETIYELLTQQYELAKVQEAKEIPSVKVLDIAVVPTKKSSPPRLLIITLGVFIAELVMIAYLLWKKAWDGTDAQDPGKRFLEEIAENLRADGASLAPEGSFLRRVLSRVSLLSAPPPKVVEESTGNKSDEEAELSRAAGNMR